MGALRRRLRAPPLCTEGSRSPEIPRNPPGEERASIGLASNLPFSEGGAVFPDPRLVAAIVDRITFNAHILETGAESYRLRTSKTTARRKRAG